MRNPVKSHRRTEAHEQRTFNVLQTYRGKVDLLRTWELQPDDVQAEFHDEIIKLRATVRRFKNYLEHRAYDPSELSGQ